MDFVATGKTAKPTGAKGIRLFERMWMVRRTPSQLRVWHSCVSFAHYNQDHEQDYRHNGSASNSPKAGLTVHLGGVPYRTLPNTSVVVQLLKLDGFGTGAASAVP
jgi:hypothetical protein